MDPLSFENVWPKIEPIIDKLINHDPVTHSEWQDLFQTVHVPCVFDETFPTQIYSVLQERISKCVQAAKQKILTYDNDLDFFKTYLMEWDKFLELSGQLPKPFHYVELAMKNECDENHPNDIKKLMLDSWKHELFLPLMNRLRLAFQSILTAQRNESSCDKFLVTRYRNCCLTILTNEEDQHHFQKPYIQAAEKYYRDNADIYLPVPGFSLDKALFHAIGKIKEEMGRAKEYLEPHSWIQFMHCCIAEIAASFCDHDLSQSVEVGNSSEIEWKVISQIFHGGPVHVTAELLNDIEKMK